MPLARNLLNLAISFVGVPPPPTGWLAPPPTGNPGSVPDLWDPTRYVLLASGLLLTFSNYCAPEILHY